MFIIPFVLQAIGLLCFPVSAQNLLRLWAVSGFPNFCSHVVFTPDGDLLTADIRNFKRWSTNGWTFKQDLFFSEGGFTVVSASPDGNWLAFAGIIGAPVRWLNLKTLELRGISSSNFVGGLAFSPDASLLAIAEGATARTIQVSDGSIVREFSADGAEVYGVAISPDGARLATAAKNGLRVWSIADGALLYAPPAPANLFRVAFSPDGTRLALSSDSTVHILNAANGTKETEYLGHNDFVFMLAWSPEGSNVLSATYSTRDPSAHLWNAANGELLHQFRASTSSINSICFSPDGKIVVTAASAVEAWDAVTGKNLGQVGAFHGTLLNCAIAPDGNTLATALGGLDLRLQLWRGSDGALLQTWQGNTSHVYAVDFAPDSALLASGGDDCHIRIWSVDSPVQIQSWVAGTNDIRTLDYAAHGCWLASGGREPWVRVWNTTNGQLVAELSCGQETNYVNTIAFSPDDSVLAAACHDGIIRLWRTTDWATAGQLHGHRRAVGTAAFSPDGKILATGSSDATIRLWNWREGRLIRTFSGHTNTVNSLAFFADGKLLLSSGRNQFLIWNTDSGRITGAFSDAYAPNVRRLAFTPDGLRFVYARSDTTLVMADVPVVLLGIYFDSAGFKVDWIGPLGEYAVEGTDSISTANWRELAGPYNHAPALLTPHATAGFYRLRFTKRE